MCAARAERARDSLPRHRRNLIMASRVTAATNTDTATTWTIDPARSRVSFSVHKRQIVIPRTVHERFTEVAGTIRLRTYPVRPAWWKTMKAQARWTMAV